MKNAIAGILLTLFVIGSLAGCASYYQVTDPASDKVYYTRSIDKEKGGAIRFEDEQSGTEVTLQNSEVKEIKSKEYNAAVKGKE